MAGFKRQILAQQDEDAIHTVSTLGELAVGGVEVLCACNRCGHGVTLAMGPLVDRLGADFPVPDIASHLRCSVCGARDVATQAAPPSCREPACCEPARNEDAAEFEEMKAKSA